MFHYQQPRKSISSSGVIHYVWYNRCTRMEIKTAPMTRIIPVAGINGTFFAGVGFVTGSDGY